MLRFRTLASAILVAFLFAGTVRADVMNLPMPADYVTDDAGVVSAGEKAQLNGLLQELERKTGAQVIILTVKSLEGNPIETVSLHLAHDLWKLGQKGKDNGLLILISTGDRKYRIEVGYGLEGILPDSAVGSIGRECFVPNFRSGNYGLGIVAAANDIAGRIAGASGVQLSQMPNPPTAQQPPVQEQSWDRMPGFITWLIIAVFIVVVVLQIFVRPHRGMVGGGAGSWWVGTGGRSGGGGFGGGGGSFGGGGGGGFGGGGASGGW